MKERVSNARYTDLIMVGTFVAIILYRLGSFLYICFTGTEIDTLTQVICATICIAAMVATVIFFGGLTFAVTDEAMHCKYLALMQYHTFWVTGVMCLFALVEWTNPELMAMGCSVAPCVIGTLGLHCMYRVRTSMTERN